MTTRNYKCLTKTEFAIGNFKLVPIRDEDKYAILHWRNEQLDILRQKELLTKEQQDIYFKNVVDALFTKEKPEQLLFSFLENDKLIGYGGLVHIDWESKNAEVSFITETPRNKDAKQFIGDWMNYLCILKTIAKQQLGFSKVFTYAYDLRPNLYKALFQAGFIEEARLKNHIEINNQLKDVLIHSAFLNDLVFRMANEHDMMQYFVWANDEDVRKNAFNTNQIMLEGHQAWFNKKLKSPNCFFYFFLENSEPVGQVRIDEIDNEMSIDISIDKKQRGKKLGERILNMACLDYFEKGKSNALYSYVKKDNPASFTLFSKAHFVVEDEVEIKSSPTYKLVLKSERIL